MKIVKLNFNPNPDKSRETTHNNVTKHLKSKMVTSFCGSVIVLSRFFVVINLIDILSVF